MLYGKSADEAACHVASWAVNSVKSRWPRRVQSVYVTLLMQPSGRSYDERFRVGEVATPEELRVFVYGGCAEILSEFPPRWRGTVELRVNSFLAVCVQSGLAVGPNQATRAGIPRETTRQAAANARALKAMVSMTGIAPATIQAAADAITAMRLACRDQRRRR